MGQTLLDTFGINGYDWVGQSLLGMLPHLNYEQHYSLLKAAAEWNGEVTREDERISETINVMAANPLFYFVPLGVAVIKILCKTVFDNGGYIDINVSGGYVGGGTGGFIFDDDGVYSYVGGGLTTPGWAVAVTINPADEPTTGPNAAVQGSFYVSGQVGFTPDGWWGTDWYGEYGVQVAGAPGINLMVFWVWEMADW